MDSAALDWSLLFTAMIPVLVRSGTPGLLSVQNKRQPMPRPHCYRPNALSASLRRRRLRLGLLQESLRTELTARTEL